LIPAEATIIDKAPNAFFNGQLEGSTARGAGGDFRQDAQAPHRILVGDIG